MKPPPCRCDAVRFPHRPGSVKNCQPPLTREDCLREGWLISLPGREHFCSDAEYWREALRPL